MADLRMPDINEVRLAGRLTRDPELKYTSSNAAFCKLGLAVSRNYKSRDGEKREDVVFIDITVWDKAAEYVAENLRKGRPVIIEGRLTMSEWDDRDTGQKRRAIEVRAQRVLSLDWDSVKADAPELRPIEEPLPEEDLPF